MAYCRVWLLFQTSYKMLRLHMIIQIMTCSMYVGYNQVIGCFRNLNLAGYNLYNIIFIQFAECQFSLCGILISKYV